MNHNYSQTTDMRSETPKTEPPSRRPRARSGPRDSPYAVNKILGQVGGMRSDGGPATMDAQKTRFEARQNCNC